MNDHELQLKSFALRRSMLQTIVGAGAGHTGGGLSCMDILNVLYNRVLNVSPQTFSDPHRDRYVQSKGHCVEALYAVLADRGFFPAADLATVCHYQSHYVGHPTRHIPGIEMNTGALGHGLPICIGMALTAKMDSASYRVFTLLGDGELAEGSNWEAGLAAAHYKLDNLVAILDHNTLQISGHTRDVMSNEPLDEKWRAFGWEVRTVDGHDYATLTQALTEPSSGKPVFVIANTVKGKGVSFMENVAKWHHGVPSAAELEEALAELNAAEAKQKEIA
ncbi:MAG: transketolase [Verrucomicrobiales bacterium]|nr:transketolase [Verrucomicrobiales bacterium]MCP5558958.1 transketolase [Verrucomicrobiaceae bacterium]